ncbi:MAG: hypothetical protein IJ899_06830 [Blautia sp.]|nr:hypothetical protein [Blautia sp.]
MMELILEAFLSGFWLLLIPLLISADLVHGYLIMFAVMEILALPMLFSGATLHMLVISYGGLLCVLAVIGMIRNHGRLLRMPGDILKQVRKGGFFLGIAIVLILFQLVFVSFMAHMDADDAFYVGQAVTDAYEDSLYQINPYTGFAYNSLPKRYALSPFPAFLAVISKLCAGVHPAVIAHRVLPSVFLLLIYLVLMKYGEWLFPEDHKAKGCFLFFCALFFQFSSWTIYNAGNFLMIRLWQGKALLAGFGLPVLILLTKKAWESGNHLLSWLPCFLGILSCCLMSSMGIVLGPVMVCTASAAMLLMGDTTREEGSDVKRRVRILAEKVGYMLLSLVPCLILGLIYLRYLL